MLVAGSAWAFGWEALVAFGTISLAVVTYRLARATQRLAAETATELQAQFRPIVVPLPETMRLFKAPLSEMEEEMAQSRSASDFREKYERHVGGKLRNLGRGPALEVAFTQLPYAALPWWASSVDVAVLPPDAEYDLDFNGLDSEESAGIRIQYRDLAGQRFSTEFNVMTYRTGVRVVGLKISEGYWDPEIPRPSMGDPLMAMPVRLRDRLTAAAETLWPPLYVDAVRPFSRRVRVAMAAMREPSSVTFTQRVRYGIRRGFESWHNRDVPSPLPQSLGGLFLFWRRVKQSYRAFRGYRGSGIPPASLYRDVEATRSRIDAINRRNQSILRRLEIRKRRGS